MQDLKKNLDFEFHKKLNRLIEASKREAIDIVIINYTIYIASEFHTAESQSTDFHTLVGIDITHLLDVSSTTPLQSGLKELLLKGEFNRYQFSNLYQWMHHLT